MKPASDQTRLTAVDLFSGCGGLSLGLRRAGFNVICAVERDQLASSTYRMNHPSTALIAADIRDLSAEDIRSHSQLSDQPIGLLAACPPCQGFSRLRTCNGKHQINDPQNDLFLSIAPFIKDLRPLAVMLENVPRVVHDERMSTVIRTIEHLGYTVSYDIFDAQDYGVPQRRKRMVLSATLDGVVSAPSPLRSHRTVRHSIGRLHIPGTGNDPMHDYSARHTTEVIKFINEVPKDGGSRNDAKSRQLECHRNSDGFKDVYGRMRWDSIAPTITGGCINPSKGRFLNPEQNRAITLREAASLQTFPKNYRFDLSRGRYAVAEMIGNAFPPRFAEHHARAIFERLQRIHSYGRTDPI